MPRFIRLIAGFFCLSGLIVTEEREAEETVDRRLIRYVPIWKFLLPTL